MIDSGEVAEALGQSFGLDGNIVGAGTVQRRDGEIAVLNRFISDILGCREDVVYEELEKLLNQILPKKALHEYGMKEEQAEEFADSVIENQQRLLNNNFAPLDRDRLIKIYRELL